MASFELYKMLSEEAVQKYGQRTLLLFQVGAFYEVYDNCVEGSRQLGICQNLLYLNVGNRPSGWYACGFRKENFERYRRMLIDARYTVLVVDQSSDDAQQRILTNIISPGFDMDAADATVSVILLVNGEAHISRLDVLINKLDMFRVATLDGDVLSKVQRALYERGPCQEIEVHLDDPNIEISDEDIVRVFPSAAVRVTDRKGMSKRCRLQRPIYDARWQRVILESNYKRFVTIGSDIVHKLGLSGESSATIASLVLLLMFARARDEKIIEYLNPPHANVTSTGKLALLDDILHTLEATESRNTCLLDIYSLHVRTPMGKRALRERIRHPISVPSKLRACHDEIDTIIREIERGGCLDKWPKSMAQIGDITKMSLRTSNGRLKPCEIGHMMKSLDLIKDILNEASQLPFCWPVNLDACEPMQAALTATVDDMHQLFHRSFIGEDDMFKRDTGSARLAQLDNLRNEFDGIVSDIGDIIATVDKLLNTSGAVTLKQAQGGSHLSISASRAKKLASGWNGCDQYGWRFSTISSTARFDDDKTACLLRRHGELREQICDEQSSLFRRIVNDIASAFFLPHGEIMSQMIAHVDLVHGVARHAIKHAFRRPSVEGDEGDPSGVKAIRIRHPVVEQIVERQNKPYVANNIELNPDMCILLHGVNSAGKSSLMKAVAINILLAQSGLFVACDSFILKPFRAIALHIGGRDDMFRSQSTFVKEIEEVNAVLRVVSKDGNGTLFLADELGNSTEDTSAVRIVSGILHMIHIQRATVMLATHMFALQDNPYVQGYKALRNYYLHVHFENEKIIFDRKLQPGLPPMREYGTVIAMRLLSEHPSMLGVLRSGLHDRSRCTEERAFVSRYNRHVVAKQCVLCGYIPLSERERPLEMHHLEEQRTALNGRVPSGKSTHDASNQIPVCPFCHDDIDRRTIIIHGYLDTSDGMELRWERVNSA